VAAFTTTNLGTLFAWATAAYPGLKAGSGVLTLVNMPDWMGMTVWALAWFRRRHIGAAAAVSTSKVAETVNVGVEANIPAVTFASFGGGEEAKSEVRVVAANRFNRGGAPVVRNGTAGEFRANFIHVRCPELMSVGVGSTACSRAHLTKASSPRGWPRPMESRVRLRRATSCQPLSRYQFAPWNGVEEAGIFAFQADLGGGPLLRVLDEAGAAGFCSTYNMAVQKCFSSMGAEGRNVPGMKSSRVEGTFALNVTKRAGEGVRALRHGDEVNAIGQ
jgi:hypothetical protein